MAFSVSELPAVEARALYERDLPRGYRIIIEPGPRGTTIDSGLAAIVSTATALQEKKASGPRFILPTKSELIKAMASAPRSSAYTYMLAHAVGEWYYRAQSAVPQLVGTQVALGIVHGSGLLGVDGRPGLDEAPVVLSCTPTEPPPLAQPGSVQQQRLVVWIHRSDLNDGVAFSGVRARTSRHGMQVSLDGSTVTGSAGKAPSIGMGPEQDKVDAGQKEKTPGEEEDKNDINSPRDDDHREVSRWVDVAFDRVVTSPLKWIYRNPGGFVKVAVLLLLLAVLTAAFVWLSRAWSSLQNGISLDSIAWPQWLHADWLTLSEWDRLRGVTPHGVAADTSGTDAASNLRVSSVTGVPQSKQLNMIRNVLDMVPFVSSAVMAFSAGLYGTQRAGIAVGDGGTQTVGLMMDTLVKIEDHLDHVANDWAEAIIRETYNLSRIRTALEAWELEAAKYGVVEPPGPPLTTRGKTAMGEDANKAYARVPPPPLTAASEKKLVALAIILRSVATRLGWVVEAMHAKRQALLGVLDHVPKELTQMRKKNFNSMVDMMSKLSDLMESIEEEAQQHELGAMKRQELQEREDRVRDSWAGWLAVRAADIYTGGRREDLQITGAGDPFDMSGWDRGKIQSVVSLLADVKGAIRVAGEALSTEEQSTARFVKGLKDELKWLRERRRTLDNIIKEFTEHESAGTVMRGKDLERIWKILSQLRSALYDGLVDKHLKAAGDTV